MHDHLEQGTTQPLRAACLLVQGIYAGLPLGLKLLQHWSCLIGAVARQGYPLRLAPLVLLCRFCPLDKANESAKLTQQLLLNIHAGACHQLVLHTQMHTHCDDCAGRGGGRGDGEEGVIEPRLRRDWVLQ